MAKRAAIALDTFTKAKPGAAASKAKAEPVAGTAQRGRKLSSKAGTVLFQANIAPAAHKQIKRLALDEDALMRDLVNEALNLLFKSRGLPQIAV